jgi:hypothetical protein
MLILVAFLGFTYFFVRIFNGDHSTKNTMGLAAFTALCLWSHYYSILPIGLSLVILIINHKPEVKKILQYCTIVMLATIPLISLANFGNLLARSSPAVIQGYAYSQITPDRYLWVTPVQMATYLPNELLCWSWIVFIPLALYAIYACRNPLLKYFGIITLITCAALIPLSHFSNLMPRYAVLVSPLVIFMAMYPISELIDDNRILGKKLAIFTFVIFTIFLFNYGSLLSWFTFNVCPLVNGVI